MLHILAAAVVVVCLMALDARAQTPPRVNGTWSGPMTLERAPGQTLAIMTVEFTLHETGETLTGHWRVSEPTDAPAHGAVNGTINHETRRVELSIVFAGGLPPPLSNALAPHCEGVARASGQLTYGKLASGEPLGWVIRVKAPNGFMLGPCKAIPRATWKLTPKSERRIP